MTPSAIVHESVMTMAQPWQSGTVGSCVHVHHIVNKRNKPWGWKEVGGVKTQEWGPKRGLNADLLNYFLQTGSYLSFDVIIVGM